MLVEILISIVILCIILILLYKIKILKEELQNARKDAVKRSRSVLEGKIYEQLVPFFPGFKWNPSDVKFMGQPIDLIIFDGLSTGHVNEIIIIEVKKGKSSLTSTQRSIKKVIEEGNVRWEIMKL